MYYNLYRKWPIKLIITMKCYTKKQLMKMLLHILQPCSNKNCNMQMIDWLISYFPIPHLSSVTILIFYTDKMNSLSEFLSSPLLNFNPSNSPSNNTEWHDKLDMLLETLSESDIQLLNTWVTDDLSDDKHQQDQGITVADASDISCHSTCSGNITDHTSSTSAFAAATEADLK